MFFDCTSLENITFPDNITSIPYGTFGGCEGLKRIEIPDGVKSISASTFFHCYSLEEAFIPDSVTFIADYSFSVADNPSLTIKCSFDSNARLFAQRVHIPCEIVNSVRAQQRRVIIIVVICGISAAVCLTVIIISYKKMKR